MTGQLTGLESVGVTVKIDLSSNEEYIYYVWSSLSFIMIDST